MVTSDDSGSCSWTGSGLSCPPGISMVSDPGHCSIRVESVASTHQGTWRCQAIPATKPFSGEDEEHLCNIVFIINFTNIVDMINMTVSSSCRPDIIRGFPDELLWTGVAVLIVILIIGIFFLFLCCCPAACLCIPLCARRVEDSQVIIINT